MDQFIAMDEEGYFILSEETRWSDESSGRELLKNLKMTEKGGCTTLLDGVVTFVEAFDKPLVAKQVFKKQNKWILLFPYHFEREILIESLVLDAWDRFHGLTIDKIPFVMSRAAQNEFFNLLDEYTDDTITIDGKEQNIPPFYLDNEEVLNDAFWQAAYLNQELPKWDLSGPHPALEPILPQIKIVKSRVVNFGCGRGHDAAFMAQKGHIVTAFDLSPSAVEEAKKLYGHIPNLTIKQGDVFKTPEKSFNDEKFDVVLEHTLFCAIPPEKRKELVVRWHQSLDTGGYLLGVFFVHSQRGGPPYGGSEWELRHHLEKHFRLLYWKRWERSPEYRQGTELVVFAQKLSK